MPANRCCYAKDPLIQILRRAPRNLWLAA